MVMPKMIINALTLFLIKYKIRDVLMKTVETKSAYTQWDGWTSYDVIKHHMITTDITLK